MLSIYPLASGQCVQMPWLIWHTQSARSPGSGLKGRARAASSHTLRRWEGRKTAAVLLRRRWRIPALSAGPWPPIELLWVVDVPWRARHSPPTRHLALYNRLRDGRREHCPSRATSPSGRKASLRQRTRGSRSRSSSRGPRSEGHRTVDSQSSLRHEVFAEEQGLASFDGQNDQHT
jgi:hypothetical protein